MNRYPGWSFFDGALKPSRARSRSAPDSGCWLRRFSHPGKLLQPCSIQACAPPHKNITIFSLANNGAGIFFRSQPMNRLFVQA
jgi:hypothetical protein